MEIREIRVGELTDFLESDLYRFLDPKPVTALRAISQSRNPRAKPDDTALIIAVEGHTLLAMAGLLPDWIAGDSSLTASSNSGWWAHPGKGRHLALPVFARAFKSCNQRMFLTDCNSGSRKILEKTGWFHFREPVAGMKVVFRFYLRQMAEHRYGNGTVSSLAGIADHVLNRWGIPLIHIFKRGRTKTSLTVSLAPDIDSRLGRFIEDHHKTEFTARSAAELNWALQDKWLVTRDTPPVNYPFSYKVKEFEQIIPVVEKEGKLTGLAIVNIREGHATVPCFYALPGEEQPVWEALIRKLKELKISTLTSYREEFTGFIRKRKIPFLFTRKVERHVAISGDLLSLFRNHPSLQDGDGDSIFT